MNASESFRLPRRPPRPLATHILIDGVVAAIVVGVPGFIAGIPLWALISVGGFIGIAAAPFTRRAESRALAKRPEPVRVDVAPPERTPNRAPRPVEINPRSVEPVASPEPPEGATA